MLKDFVKKLQAEHLELYQKLQFFLTELAKNKVEIDREHLMKNSKACLAYLKKLIDGHFKLEEEKLFPVLVKLKLPKEDVKKLIDDHKEIKQKFVTCFKNFKALNSGEETELDLKQDLLFKLYNLLATINHHAQREDKIFFKLKKLAK